MSTFRVGDSVIIHPDNEVGVIANISKGNTNYPISVFIGDKFEGSYTIDGYRYLDPEYKNEYCITLANTTTKVDTNVDYWTIIQANSSFIQLSRPEYSDVILPIHSISCISAPFKHVIICTNNSCEFNLGSVTIQTIADMLFTNEFNSIK